MHTQSHQADGLQRSKLIDPRCDILPWSDGNLTIGIARQSTNRDMSFQTRSDLIVLFDRNYTVYGGFNTDKKREVTFKGGDFSFAQTGTESYSVCDQREPALFLEFAPQYRERYLEQLGSVTRLDEPLAGISGLKNAQTYTVLIRNFVHSKGFGGTLRAESILTLLMSDIFMAIENDTSKPAAAYSLSKHKLKTIRAYVDEHLDHKIGVQELADLVGISAFHFARTFKQATGMPPHQFILGHRVDRAQSLLRDTGMNLAEIAYEVGFSSQSHMTECFRKKVGTTPARYRRAIAA